MSLAASATAFVHQGVEMLLAAFPHRRRETVLATRGEPGVNTLGCLGRRQDLWSQWQLSVPSLEQLWPLS